MRIEIKEPTNKSIKYYQKYFTHETSKILAKNISVMGVIGPFDNSEDPRYNESISPTPEDDWYKYLSRDVLKIKIHNPTINSNEAAIEVDTRIKGNTQDYRSVYYLVKTKSGWRISNIMWGPKGCFEEKTTQGTHSIF